VPAIIPWFARRISIHNNDLKLPAGPRGASFWNPDEWQI